MKMNELVIYTDESEKTGRYYSNFYGGLLVRACDIEPIISTLETKKLELNLLKEVKWVKVTENYLEKYMELMDTFFDFVEKDQIKIRIMFTQNRYIPTNLSKDQLQNQYHLLYYQFFKHAFVYRKRQKKLRLQSEFELISTKCRLHVNRLFVLNHILRD